MSGFALFILGAMVGAFLALFLACLCVVADDD